MIYGNYIKKYEFHDRTVYIQFIDDDEVLEAEGFEDWVEEEFNWHGNCAGFFGNGLETAYVRGRVEYFDTEDRYVTD